MAQPFIGPLLEDGSTGARENRVGFFESGGGFENILRSYSLFESTRSQARAGTPNPLPAQRPPPLPQERSVFERPEVLVGLGVLAVVVLAATRR